MKRRTRPGEEPAWPANWTVSTSYRHGAQELTPGRELTISGERGATFRFLRHVTAEPADRKRRAREWIDVIGGSAGVQMYRSFRPDRIARVLRAK